MAGGSSRAGRIPRYTGRPLPARRYLPGRGPHPSRGEPLGPTRGAPLPRFDPVHWSECEEYLYAIDLYNARYWWECHEVLEALWRAAGRTTPAGRALRGLIQIAAANLQVELGARGGALRLARRGLAALDSTPSPCLGVDLRGFAAAVRGWLAGGGHTPPLRPRRRRATAPRSRGGSGG
jgi:predicted metal-dependent hydrolase